MKTPISRNASSSSSLADLTNNIRTPWSKNSSSGDYFTTPIVSNTSYPSPHPTSISSPNYFYPEDTDSVATSNVSQLIKSPSPPSSIPPMNHASSQKQEQPSASWTVKAAFANSSSFQSQVPESISSENSIESNPCIYHHQQHQSTNAFQRLETRRSNVPLSIRLLSSETRADASGAAYTVYLMNVGERKTYPGTAHPIEQEDQNEYKTRVIEHRYSEFAKLNRELIANGVRLNSEFPMKHWAGRIGNWTPAKILAPEKELKLIQTREVKLDYWLVELSEQLQNCSQIDGSLRKQVLEFLSVSSASVPPSDRANFINWDGDLDGNEIIHGENDSLEPFSQSESIGEKHAGLLQKYISNPLSFTLGSSIRQAAYTVLQMCGSKSTFSYKGNQTDQVIPLDLLHQAKGLCFLTVVKGGFVMSVRGGTGLIIAKRTDGTWSAPSAVKTAGLGWGALIGGDITNYLIVLNTDSAIRAFSQQSGTVNLGAELGVSMGPVGRGGSGNLNKGSRGGICAAYAYAHSKGLFAGFSFEGGIVTSRPDVNSKFYGHPISVQELLFDQSQPRPRAAQPLYDALDEAMSLSFPERGFRPSQLQILK